MKTLLKALVAVCGRFIYLAIAYLFAYKEMLTTESLVLSSVTTLFSSTLSR